MIECQIGGAHQGGRVGAVPRTDRDADAGADDGEMAFDQVGAAQQVHQAQTEGLCPSRRRERHRELVTAEAAHDIVLTRGGAQPLRHHLQESVANGMAVAVVDRFEAVEIYHEHSDLVRRAGPIEQRGQALAKPLPVGQAGQAIGPSCRNAGRSLDAQGGKPTVSRRLAEGQKQHSSVC